MVTADKLYNINFCRVKIFLLYKTHVGVHLDLNFVKLFSPKPGPNSLFLLLKQRIYRIKLLVCKNLSRSIRGINLFSSLSQSLCTYRYIFIERLRSRSRSSLAL